MRPASFSSHDVRGQHRGRGQDTASGKRYWYGPGYYRDSSTDAKAAKPYEIDGKTYLFSNSGYMQTGIVYYMYSLAGTSAVLHYYDCGTDGVATLLNGIYNDNLYEDGVRQITYKLFTLDGALYFLNGHNIAKSKTLYLSERFVEGKTFPDGRAVQAGYYNFDAEGATEAMQIVSTLQAKLDKLTEEQYGIGLTVEDEEFEEPLENLQDYGHKVATLNQLELNPKANAEEIDKINILAASFQ